MSFPTWNPDFISLPGQAVFDHEQQQLAVVSRYPGQVDVFVIGFDNRVWTTFWNENSGWNADFFPLPGQAVFDHEKQLVAAISRAAGNLDLFVIGFDNRVWSTFWNEAGGGWNGDWFRLPGQAVFDHEKQHVAAVSRAAGNLDLFIIGFNNHVWSTFWGPRAPMTLEVHIDQNSPTVPMLVGMHVSATDGIVTVTEWHATKDGLLLPQIGDSIPAGVAFDRTLSIGDPGSYEITVNRTGMVGPAGLTTLTRHFTILARTKPEPGQPEASPRSEPPTINVDFSGSIEHARFHVIGSGFLPNRPNNNHGVAIRVVDVNSLIETRREFTGSSQKGAIDHTIEGDLSGLTVNALGVATIAISATDGRSNQADLTGFLWSNTVAIDFRA